MKLFKILMSLIIAAIAAVIVCGSLTSCHTLKKNSSKSETKSDSVSISKSHALRFDSATAISIKHRNDSLYSLSTDDYNRKTVVEEYIVPTEIEKSDYESRPIYTGDTAAAIWSAGHLKKRTTTWEKGLLTKTETATRSNADSSAHTSAHKQEEAFQHEEKGSRVETNVQQVKQSSTAFRGWVIAIIGVVIAIGLMYWLYKSTPVIPFLNDKSKHDD